jgi:hypothetical protein
MRERPDRWGDGPGAWVSLLAWTDAWLGNPARLRRGSAAVLDAFRLRHGTTDVPADWSAQQIAITVDGHRCRVPDRNPEASNDEYLADPIENLFLRTSLEALARFPALVQHHPLGRRLIFADDDIARPSSSRLFATLLESPSDRPDMLLRERAAYLIDALSEGSPTLPDLAGSWSPEGLLPFTGSPVFSQSDQQWPLFPQSESEKLSRPKLGCRQVDDSEEEPNIAKHTAAPGQKTVGVEELLLVPALPAQAASILTKQYGISTAAQLRDHFPDDLPQSWRTELARWLLRRGFPLPEHRIPGEFDLPDFLRFQ